MGNNKQRDMSKKEIADYCEKTYLDTSLTKKQMRDRLGVKIKNHLKKIGIISEHIKVGQHSELHYKFTSKVAAVGEANRVSSKLREWKDAILALGMKHHLIERNLERASKHLSEFIPDFDAMMSPNMPIEQLRENWKTLYKNEKRGKKRDAVLKALADIRYEHHAYYLVQPVYVWARKVGTSKDKQAQDHKVQNQIKVNPEFAISTATELIKKNLETSIDKVNKFELGVALSIATGRRRTEVFKTARFSFESETTAENHIVFSGQLKTKDRSLFDDVKPYQIPCLIDRELLIKGYDLLRKVQENDVVEYLDQRGNEVSAPVLGAEYNDQYHNTAVSQFYSHSAGDMIKHLFKSPLIEFRHSRDMYSEIGYLKHKKPGEGRSAYRTRVYGHATGQSETQRAYEKFELDSSVKSAEIISSRDERVCASQNAPVIKALKAKNEDIEKYSRRSPYAMRVHNWLIEQLELGLSADKITPAYIRKNIMLPDIQQLNFRSLKNYLTKLEWDEIKDLALAADEVTEQEETKTDEQELDEVVLGQDSIDDEAEEDDNPETEVPAKEPAETKLPEKKPATKPRVLFQAPAQQEDGTWLVKFTVNGEQQEELVEEADNMRQAGQRAWDQYQAKQEPELPKKMPKPNVVKQNAGWWLAQITFNGRLLAEEMVKGKREEAVQAVIAQYKKKYPQK